MTVNTKIVLATALFAALASPALAADEWIVNSGRYVNGAVPSYETQKSLYMMINATRLTERLDAGYVAYGSSHWPHEAVVQALGN